MQELININKANIDGTEVNSVNSREIWEHLEVQDKYNTWIKRAIEKYDFIENEDFIAISRQTTGRPSIDYIVTLDMAKELCMISNTLKGKETRKYFIKVEKEANKPLTIEQILELNQKTIESLNGKVVVLENKNEELQVENEEMKPKALFADTVSQSEDSILIGQFAKVISKDGFHIGQNRMFSWLRDNKYLIASGSSKNQPYQRYVDNNYFEIITRTISNANGKAMLVHTVKITGKGQVALTKKIIADNGLIVEVSN